MSRFLSDQYGEFFSPPSSIQPISVWAHYHQVAHTVYLSRHRIHTSENCQTTLVIAVDVALPPQARVLLSLSLFGHTVRSDRATGLVLDS